MRNILVCYHTINHFLMSGCLLRLINIQLVPKKALAVRELVREKHFYVTIPIFYANAGENLQPKSSEFVRNFGGV